MENIEIPAGYVHRSALIERGWTSRMINSYLNDVVKVDAPEGVSNKAYNAVDALVKESQIAEVRMAVAAVADLIPATGPYTEENTISRAALVGRGWTAAHITRLLGGPDAIGLGDSYRYGADRVEIAEATDAKLIRRLATVAKKKDAAITAKVEEAGEIIFRYFDGEWMVEGMDLTAGEMVTVTKKDGSTRMVRVGQIVEDHGGRRIAKVDRTRQTTQAAPAKEEQVFTPVARAPRTPATVVAGRASVGEVINLGGREIRVLSASSTFIDSDSPSVYGPHLLGHEDEWGTYITYQTVGA